MRTIFLKIVKFPASLVSVTNVSDAGSKNLPVIEKKKKKKKNKKLVLGWKKNFLIEVAK